MEFTDSDSEVNEKEINEQKRMSKMFNVNLKNFIFNNQDVL